MGNNYEWTLVKSWLDVGPPNPENAKAMLDDGDAKGDYTYSADNWDNIVL